MVVLLSDRFSREQLQQQGTTPSLGRSLHKHAQSGPWRRRSYRLCTGERSLNHVRSRSYVHITMRPLRRGATNTSARHVRSAARPRVRYRIAATLITFDRRTDVIDSNARQLAAIFRIRGPEDSLLLGGDHPIRQSQAAFVSPLFDSYSPSTTAICHGSGISLPLHPVRFRESWQYLPVDRRFLRLHGQLLVGSDR